MAVENKMEWSFQTIEICGSNHKPSIIATNCQLSKKAKEVKDISRNIVKISA